MNAPPLFPANLARSLGLLAVVLVTTSLPGETPRVRQPLPPPEVIAELPEDGGEEFNRLIFEKSPYLLQHARNPVDWYPWGDEAFEKARKENKPVFLSVGYSACHWCHVMEHESFEDEEVAALMNEAFINVKVDREERPDVDKVYMDATQRMTGSGGWPMTVVMTAEKKPFFAGTYFPKASIGNRPGMLDMVPQLQQAWTNDRANVLAIAERVTSVLNQINAGAPGGDLGEATLKKAFDNLSTRFDGVNGGFAQAPKFPVPHNLSFLLRYWKRTGDAHALKMVETTLTKMRMGGIYDHVGFGFHRYSTDPVWLLPHFEKMLYDQALLAIAYLEAYQATGKAGYATTAREIFTYVLRDMTSAEGGFYSAEDADSEGEEGKFYVWTPEEINEVLGEFDGNVFRRSYGIVSGGNFKDQSTGKPTGASIPFLRNPIATLANASDVPEDYLRTQLDAARLNLFAVRESRVHPFKDDKVLTDWNGLMVAALARGARVLDDETYRKAAQRAADFVLKNLSAGDGRLLKRYRQGEAGLPAHVEDYAFLSWGLIELYQATFEQRYLAEAVRLTELMLKHFWDEERGGLFFTADDGEALLVRGKEIYDGAIPSGNSAAALNLVRLSRLTGNVAYEERARAITRSFSGILAEQPSISTLLMQALEFMQGPAHEVVVVGDPEKEDTQAMLKAVDQEFHPNMVVLLKRPKDKELARLVPYTAEMKQLEKKATAYVCRNFACDLPTTEVEKMLASLAPEEKQPEEAP